MIVKKRAKTVAEEMITCTNCGCGVFAVRAPSFRKYNESWYTHFYGECVKCNHQMDFGHDSEDCPELSQ